MTHWSDPTQIAYHARIFTEVLLVLIGFYGYVEGVDSIFSTPLMVVS